MKSSKVGVVCALLTEGEALIEKYSMKIVEKKPFLLFENEDISLIISGIGKINAAIATTYLLQKESFYKVLNIGICASKNKDDLYKIFSIKSVIDFASEKKYLLKNDGATITTVDNPSINPSNIKSSLADMEASGFLLAAKKFLPIKNIEIIKIVSDNFDNSIPQREFVKKLMGKVVMEFKI